MSSGSRSSRIHSSQSRNSNQPLPSSSKWADAVADDTESQQTGYKPGQGDTEWMAEKTKTVQADSLYSTRRTLDKINRADEIARSNLERLNQQSEQLRGVAHKLQETESHGKVNI